MRKNFKRKNYVLFGAIGIAAVALSSVGFATWITGMQQTTQTGSISVTVDTASNDTLYLDVALKDSSISIHQKATTNNGKMYVTGNDTETDLSISFSKFKVYVSSKYNPSTVKVTMGVSFLNGDAAYNSVVYTNGGIAKAVGQDTYITLPSVLTGENGVSLKASTSTLEGYTVKELNDEDLTVSFGWGTAFGGEDPVTHYNNKIDTKVDTEEKLTVMNEATTTLNEMNSLLNGKTIKLSFELTTTPVQQS